GTTCSDNASVPASGCTASLSGALNSPITVRSFPGEWAVIQDSRSLIVPSSAYSILTVTGNHLTIRALDVTSVILLRSANVANASAPGGISLQGTPSRNQANRIKIINNVIHDTGVGISTNQ